MPCLKDLLGNAKDLIGSCELSVSPFILLAQNGEISFTILDGVTELIASKDCKELQPTPISIEGSINVVPKLSVNDDLNLLRNDLVVDALVSWLAKGVVEDDGTTRVSTLHKMIENKDDSKEGLNNIASDDQLFDVQEALYRPIKKQRISVSPQEIFGSDDLHSSECNEFQSNHCEKWKRKFKNLLAYKEIHGHCSVPNIYPENPKLAQWVKRQRYQYKLKMDGKYSTLSDERQDILEQIGFVWDSHEASWMERLNELKEFQKEHGHSNVPSNFTKNRKLSTWVKCQRRQYKLYQIDEKSNMTLERILLLDALDFDWNPRNL